MVKLKQIPTSLASPPSRLNHPPKQTDAFYQSPEWRALIRHLIKERGRKCVRCGARNRRIIGDHIQELKDGGARLDPNNVQLLCINCHNRKTADAKRARST